MFLDNRVNDAAGTFIPRSGEFPCRCSAGARVVEASFKVAFDEGISQGLFCWVLHF